MNTGPREELLAFFEKENERCSAGTIGDDVVYRPESHGDRGDNYLPHVDQHVGPRQSCETDEHSNQAVLEAFDKFCDAHSNVPRLATTNPTPAA